MEPRHDVSSGAAAVGPNCEKIVRRLGLQIAHPALLRIEDARHDEQTTQNGSKPAPSANKIALDRFVTVGDCRENSPLKSGGRGPRYPGTQLILEGVLIVHTLLLANRH